MAGSKKGAVIVQERDRRLLEEIAIMRVVSREQAKVVAGFNSTTRANVRLLKLTRVGLLRRTFIGGNQAVYSLTARTGRGDEGRSAQPASGEPSTLFYRHQLEINWFYLTTRFRSLPTSATFVRWLRFDRPLSQAAPLIPDAYVEIASPDRVRSMFLEVDLATEPLSVWSLKVRRYVQLAVSGEYAQQFGQQQFRVLVATTTPRRLEGIRSTVRKATDRVFWLTTLPELHTHGLWSPIWLRPQGEQKQPLI